MITEIEKQELQAVLCDYMHEKDAERAVDAISVSFPHGIIVKDKP
jgi:hypothetical protein